MATAGADTQVQDMEEGSSSEEEDEPVEQTVEDPKKTAEAMKAVPAPPMPAPPVQPPPIQAPLPGNVIVKKYDPKAAAAVRKKTEEDQFLISPLTGEKIPAGKVAEHMKVRTKIALVSGGGGGGILRILVPVLKCKQDEL